MFMSEKSQRAFFCNNKFKAIFLALIPPLWLTTSIITQKSALAQTAGEGCPTGTKLAGAPTNLIQNGTFNVQPSGPFGTLFGNPVFQGLPANTPLPTGTAGVSWSSNLPYVASNSSNPPNYPPDSGVSIQSGVVNYAGGIVQQVPFPGDPANGVPGSNTWLYSNGNNTGAPYAIWQQQITGVLPNTTYIFYTYVSNAIATNASAPDDPIIRFLVNGTPLGASFQVFDDSDPSSGHSGADLWDRKSIRYTTGANETSLTLTVRDEQLGSAGDDFGIVAIGAEPCRPNVGIAKSVGTPVANTNGSFTVPYTLTVQNYAPAETQYNLTQLQVNDDLATTFAGATINSVTEIQSGTLAANTAFNGGSNKNLLQGTDTLAGQQSATITFNVNVTPGTSLGPFNNTASVTGNHAASAALGPVTDTSVNGTDADTGGNETPVNGDRDPSNNTSPTPVSFTSIPPLGSSSNLRLLKRITGVTRNGAPLNSVSFTGVDADTDANALVQAGLRPIGVRAIPATNSLTSNDEVEYTIYFLSDGGQAANKVNFCDLIPTGTTYIPNSTVVQVGNTPLTSSDRFLPSLTPLPAGNYCLNQNNANGALLVDLGNVPNTNGNNFGFIRLRVKIN
jgi:uncharacterized repeat protein (TIGR01451 family)